MFLKLDGIEGDSERPRHVGSIEIRGFTWGNELRPLSGSMIGPGKIQIRDLTLFKQPDISSPVLRWASSSGKNFSEAAVTVEEYSHTGSLVGTTVIELESVQVDIVTAAGIASDSAMTEMVVLNFANYKLSRQSAEHLEPARN